jgi:hypothetical protein
MILALTPGLNTLHKGYKAIYLTLKLDKSLPPGRDCRKLQYGQGGIER